MRRAIGEAKGILMARQGLYVKLADFAVTLVGDLERGHRLNRGGRRERAGRTDDERVPAERVADRGVEHDDPADEVRPACNGGLGVPGEPAHNDAERGGRGGAAPGWHLRRAPARSPG
ncbi:Uncharacterised protein [Amycolatopsis camponoti]|uniref:Uncharacterized protein n=1 Tax=Amycolatopsis camponoti TaxID=2606593 RepID=A0A6I8M127_9PSEU|nr:Uncharacterised protein [Amycolatopsis camponoti]